METVETGSLLVLFIFSNLLGLNSILLLGSTRRKGTCALRCSIKEESTPGVFSKFSIIAFASSCNCTTGLPTPPGVYGRPFKSNNSGIKVSLYSFSDVFFIPKSCCTTSGIDTASICVCLLLQDVGILS